MNPSNPSTLGPAHDVTRRNFMKKSALSVGAVTFLGKGTGLATSFSPGLSFDMKCIEPAIDYFDGATFPYIIGDQYCIISLRLNTSKYEDPVDAHGYNFCSVGHDFELMIDKVSNQGEVLGSESIFGFLNYDIVCDPMSGAISSEFRPITSHPGFSPQLNKEVSIGGRDVTMYVNVVTQAGGSTVKTKIWGTIFIASVVDPEFGVSIWIPDRAGYINHQPTLEIENEFA